MSPAPKAEGTFWVRTEPDREGRPWELVVRVEPLAGCAVDVPTGYRVSLLTYPVGGGPKHGDTVRITGCSTWRSWEEACRAAETLVQRLRTAGGAP